MHVLMSIYIYVYRSIYMYIGVTIGPCDSLSKCTFGEGTL